MRNHAINRLVNLAERNSDIVLINGDLGFGVLDDFEKKFPERCINAGICEQNMMCVAAGLALANKIVYVYSIGNFPVMRCLEQIRNDVCYHNLNVKIIVVGGGFAYGQLGMSHHATEDLALMRSMPNMHIYSPSDPTSAEFSIEDSCKTSGPCYIRLGKGKEPLIYEKNMVFNHSLMMLKSGQKYAVVSTGSVLNEVLDAAKILELGGLNIAVFDMLYLKPFDAETIIDQLHNYEYVITVEEHNIIGGIGSLLSEVFSDIDKKKPLIIKMGLQDAFTSIVGSQSYLRNVYGISSDAIVDAIKGLKQ